MQYVPSIIKFQTHHIKIYVLTIICPYFINYSVIVSLLPHETKFVCFDRIMTEWHLTTLVKSPELLNGN